MPVVAEPVFVDGAMHVDGGAREQLFLRNVLEPVLEEAHDREGRDAAHRPVVYALVNGHVDVVDAEETRNHVLPILARTIEVLLAENKVGNLLRVAATARDMGAEVRVSAVPPDEPLFDSYSFEPAAMAALMDKGRAFGRANRWDETLARLAGEYGLASEKALGR